MNRYPIAIKGVFVAGIFVGQGMVGLMDDHVWGGLFVIGGFMAYVLIARWGER
jgi:hypothetical protein